MPRRSLLRLYQDEFREYTFQKLQQDTFAGLTVAAVALPLALAFGVASGATASAGLVTAIVSGLLIGALSGAPYQISGPTGAMSAVLIVLAQKYGLPGVWVSSLIAGFFLLTIGLLRLGRFIAFIPSAVITGFTSGIALIIFIGQIDNFLGTATPGQDTALLKLIGYFQHEIQVDFRAILLAVIVIGVMLAWPKKWNVRFPASLLAIILVTGLNAALNWPVMTIGKFPQTLFLSDRLALAEIPWANIQDFIPPALTITALGAIESLLCGAVGSKMTGVRLQANQELIAQGIGNMVIPFLGGVPATAAIARSSVGIKSGGQTRLVSIIHALGLLVSMLALAPVMARIPLAGLAGVLMVTAFRMNEWPAIRFMFKRRFKSDILAFCITMLATITLDLTQAILIGSLIAAALFLNKIASLEVEISHVDPEKLRQKGIQADGRCRHVRVAFLTGPLFFAAVGNFEEAFANISGINSLILSMRGVPMMDTSGLEVIRLLQERLHAQGGMLMLAGVHENARRLMERGGLVDQIGRQNFFWSSDQAIVEAEKRGCLQCGLESDSDTPDQ